MANPATTAFKPRVRRGIFRREREHRSLHAEVLKAIDNHLAAAEREVRR